MGAGHDAHCAIGNVALRKRNPCGHDVGVGKAPVSRVLVPGNVSRVVRLFDEEARPPDQQIGAEDVFDGVEDARMADELVGPFEHHVRFVAKRRFHDQAMIEFERLDLLPVGVGLGRGKDANRKVVAIFVKCVHLGPRQDPEGLIGGCKLRAAHEIAPVQEKKSQRLSCGDPCYSYDHLRPVSAAF